MKFGCLLATLGLMSVSVFSTSAFALDQLPLPDAALAHPNAQIAQFVRETAGKTSGTRTASADCETSLKSDVYYHGTMSDKIRAIKAYRQCRAEQALQQLAVWRWQDNLNDNMN